MKSPNQKKKYGFTMIEMVVSVAIIALVSSVFLANYHGTNRKAELNLVAQKMVSDIRMAQNYSLSTKEKSTGVSVPGGWGIRASTTASNNNHYVIFADTDSSKTYASSKLFKKIDLPSGITISGITVNDVASGMVDIVFLPPDPATYINGTQNIHVDISLKDKDGNTKVITVNYLGLVDVDDSIAASVTCNVDSDCSEGWCYSNQCRSPWLSGPCAGMTVYKSDVAGFYQWKTVATACDTPQCGIDGGQTGDNLVASNAVDFSAYPARNACKAIGGRLPSSAELFCIYTNRATYSAYGGFQTSTGYWSSTEGAALTSAWVFFLNGSWSYGTKTGALYTRCVK